MNDEYGAVETTDEATASTESQEASGNLRRGRPRDPGVIERDSRVYEALESGEPKTKSQLAEELSLAPNTVYLSLWRLHKDGRVARNQRQWQRV